MDARLERRISALAERQAGYLARRQLLELGLDAHAIKHWIRTHRLIPEYAGVYGLGHLPTRAPDRAVGALLACGRGAVLSHGSAAAVWGIFKRWEMPFEVTVPSARCRRGIRVHRSRLEGRDIRRQGPLRLTSPARTLHDVALRMTDKALRRAVNDLQRRDELRLHQLEEVVKRLRYTPGSARLRPLLDSPDGNPTRSGLEDDFVAFAEHYGLPRPQVNVFVAGREVDAWFPDERLIVEIDSWDFHSDRDSFEGDRDKDATALELGIATIRLTKRRMRREPEHEAQRVLRILRARRG